MSLHEEIERRILLLNPWVFLSFTENLLQISLRFLDKIATSSSCVIYSISQLEKSLSLSLSLVSWLLFAWRNKSDWLTSFTANLTSVRDIQCKSTPWTLAKLFSLQDFSVFLGMTLLSATFLIELLFFFRFSFLKNHYTPGVCTSLWCRLLGNFVYRSLFEVSSEVSFTLRNIFHLICAQQLH